MISYCLKCKNYKENINPRTSKASNNKTMLLSKWSVCGSKKSRFIKEQEVSELFIRLGIKTPFSKIPLLGNILF